MKHWPIFLLLCLTVGLFCSSLRPCDGATSSTLPLSSDDSPTSGVTKTEELALLAENAKAFPQPEVKLPITPAGKKILVINLKQDFAREMINAYTAYYLDRAYLRVKSGDIGAVILDIDTPGGYSSYAFMARDALIKMEPVVTSCYVRRALSAGSLLMLACDNIFVAPGSSLGDAQTIMMLPGGGATSMEDDEALFDKMSAAGRTEWEATAERKGHRADIARAFADRREAVPGLVDNQHILNMTGKQAVAARLAISELSNIDKIPPLLGMADSPMETFSLSAREIFAFRAKSLSWLFLALAVIGFYIEFTTPGFAIPGGLAILSLCVFFWSNFMAMTASWFEIGLFTVGLGLLIAEITVIPGFGVAGISGIFCILLSVFLSMFKLPDLSAGPDMALTLEQMEKPFINLIVVTGFILAAGLLALRYLPQSPLWRLIGLKLIMSSSSGYTSLPSQSQWIGREGTAKSTLRPGGIIMIDGSRLDAMSRGEFIPVGSTVRVVAEDGPQLVVTLVETKTPVEEPPKGLDQGAE